MGEMKMTEKWSDQDKSRTRKMKKVIGIPFNQIFNCPMIIKGEHPKVDFFFCREYCMYYNGNSNKLEQGFYCEYENQEV